MAAYEQAPLDPETGLPPVVLGQAESPEHVNYHHHWFPKRHKHLEQDFPYVSELATESLTLQELGGIAVRMSRGQVMPVEVHVRFHQRYLGPKLPVTLDEKFRVAVRGCSGVVPRTAVNIVNPYETQFVRLKEEDYRRISDERAVRPEHHYYWHHIEKRRALLGDFFIRYALSQDLTGAPERVVGEFLGTHDARKRRELGNFLLISALDASVEPVKPVHAELRKKGLVMPHAPGVLASVKKQLVPHRLPRYHDYLADRLSIA